MPRRAFFRGFPGFRLSPPFSQSENGYAALPIPAATLFANKEKFSVNFMEKLTEFLKILTDFFKILTENFCTFHGGLQKHIFLLLYRKIFTLLFRLFPMRAVGGNRSLTGELPDGRRVNVRDHSSDGRPTLEVQEGKNRIKVRYGEGD
ncbi:MAG: hypothetical protein II611_04880 [Treponema sp.]|nr:hypothetical protein [Treponema sp.]